MQNLIFSFILLFIGCGSSQDEPVATCVSGTFGNNKVEYQYAPDAIRGVAIEDLERKLTFKPDGTGSIYRPAFKGTGRPFGQWEASFSYKVTENTIKIAVSKLIIDGLDVEKDIEKGAMAIYLKNLGIFNGVDDEISFTCDGSSITITKAYFISVVSNINGGVQLKKESDIKSEQWIKRN